MAITHHNRARGRTGVALKLFTDAQSARAQAKRKIDVLIHDLHVLRSQLNGDVFLYISAANRTRTEREGLAAIDSLITTYANLHCASDEVARTGV